MGLLSLTSCKKSDDRSLYEQYYSKLKVIKTPYKMWCGIESEQFAEANRDTMLERRLQMSKHQFYLVGRLYPDKSFITLLYGEPADYIMPVLHTFSKKGESLDILTVGGCCVAGPGYDATTTTYFGNDMVFSIIDSIRTNAVDSSYNAVPGTDSLTVTAVRYKLDENGRFHFIDSSTVTRAR